MAISVVEDKAFDLTKNCDLTPDTEPFSKMDVLPILAVYSLI